MHEAQLYIAPAIPAERNICDNLRHANSASTAQRSTQEHPGERLDPNSHGRTCLSLLVLNETLRFCALAGLQLFTSAASTGKRVPVSSTCTL